MARVVLSQPVAEIHGAFTKGGEIINRQKKYRDEQGRVVHEGGAGVVCYTPSA